MTNAFRGCTIAAVLSAALAACSSDPTIPNAGNAELTVVHASPATGLVDVRVAERSVVNGLAYGRSSGAVRVPAGPGVITVRSGGNEIARVSADLGANEGMALTIGEDTTQMSPVIPDTGFAVSSRANLRLVNVVGPTDADPTMLSMRLSFPDRLSPDSIAVIGLDAKVASHGPLMYFDPGHFRVWFVPQGSMTVLAQAEFDVAAGEKALIVLERGASGSYSVRIVRER